jgi:chlorobactene glucosyltransferase
VAHTAGFLILGVLVALAVVQHLNLREFRKVSNAGAATASVSILVPARDEERSIERCVRSLASQPALELLVLNDGSTDRTGEILSRLSAEFANLRTIEGAPLPPGWRGKNWACHQLAKEAHGEYLLFTDADTEHTNSVAAAVAYARERSAGLVSLMPRQVMVTAAERFTMPLLNFIYLTFFPAFMLRLSKDPKFSAANGQFLLFRRDAYDRIGGHESVRDSIVDDLALARRIREEELTLAIADGDEVVSCRMYSSGREIIEGFSKNLYSAVGGKVPAALAVGIFILVTFVAPTAMAVATLQPAWIAAALLGIIMRIRSGDRTPWAVLHALSMALAVAVLWRSMVRGGTVAWKGRTV